MKAMKYIPEGEYIVSVQKGYANGWTPLVRCKDCKYGEAPEAKLNIAGRLDNTIYCKLSDTFLGKEGFCSSGEKL